MHFTYFLTNFSLMFLVNSRFGLNFVVNFAHTRVIDFTITRVLY